MGRRSRSRHSGGRRRRRGGHKDRRHRRRDSSTSTESTTSSNSSWQTRDGRESPSRWRSRSPPGRHGGDYRRSKSHGRSRRGSRERRSERRSVSLPNLPDLPIIAKTKKEGEAAAAIVIKSSDSETEVRLLCNAMYSLQAYFQLLNFMSKWCSWVSACG